MILFRSCPECHSGDLIKTRDAFGEYMECAQCGYVRTIEHASDESVVKGVIIPFPARTWEDDGPPRPRSA